MVESHVMMFVMAQSSPVWLIFISVGEGVRIFIGGGDFGHVIGQDVLNLYLPRYFIIFVEGGYADGVAIVIMRRLLNDLHDVWYYVCRLLWCSLCSAPWGS